MASVYNNKFDPSKEDLWVRLNTLLSQFDDQVESRFFQEKAISGETQKNAAELNEKFKEIKQLVLQQVDQSDPINDVIELLAGKINRFNPTKKHKTPQPQTTTINFTPATPSAKSYKIIKTGAPIPQQKIDPLKEISILFRSNKEDDAMKRCESLTNLGELQEALWHVRNHPSYQGDFGQDSLFDKCSEESKSSPAQKAAAAELLLLVGSMNNDSRAKIDKAQAAVKNTQTWWVNVDQHGKSGKAKNAEKVDSLKDLANCIVPLFEPAKSVTPPTIKQESFRAHAEAYVKAYPCLFPFMLQLIPDLKINGESLAAIIQGPKSSEDKPTDCGQMQDKGKQYRIGIINETLATLRDGYYINSDGLKVELDLTHAVNSIQCFNANSPRKQAQFQLFTSIFLDKKDCLSVAKDCYERGLNPIVLDMANNGDSTVKGQSQGGGYLVGAGAQEENLCRRSGLSFAAFPEQKLQNKNYYVNKGIEGNGPGAALYVANVPVFRGEEGNGYPYLKTPFECAFAITAAYDFNPAHTGKQLVNGRIPQAEADETKERLRSVYKMAVANGHQAIVLSAFGCGAFRNPPEQICEIINELNVEFNNAIKEVRVAVIDDHNTGKGHNPNGNYAVFNTLLKR